MTNQDVVNTDLTNQHAEEAKSESETTEEVKETASNPEPVKEVTKAGDKTDPNELLDKLQQERVKRREAESLNLEKDEKIKELETSSTSSESEVYSPEGLELQKDLRQVRQDMADLKKENAKKDLLLRNPVIKEHLKEFDEYQADPANRGMNLNTAAKAFMADKGLLDATTPRKGLEKATGGDKAPTKVGKMSHADAERLRTTNFDKYREMVINDQIQIED